MSDLSLGTGEVLGIVGESGAGKTMLARAIMRLVPSPGRISGGTITFDGRDLAHARRREPPADPRP